jgi:hypothetical protein
MPPERRRRTEELFQGALDLPLERREEYLRARCGDDVELLAEAQRLLRIQGELGDFLEPLLPPEGLLGPESGDGSDAPGSEPGRSEVPDTIGHYRVEREIGRGGMGKVYLAEDTKLGRKAAVKMLPAEFAHDPMRLRLFENEARTAGNLNHPNIATIYEFDEENGFIAMEFVPGRLLSEFSKRSRPIPVAGIISIGVQIAEGLTAAHANKVIHRDLKPGNLMITPRPERRVKILDFGIAKAIQEDLSGAGGAGRSPSSSGSGVLGTLGYSSPEQLRGQPIDQRSDLFSLGVVLYEVATGTSPFLRATLAETNHAVLHEEPPPATSLNARLPLKLAALIRKLISKRPQERPRSAAKVLAKLRGIQQEFEAEREGRKTRRPLQVIVASAAVLSLAAVGWMIMTEQELDPRFEQLAGYIARGDVPEAAHLLGVLEGELGRSDARLTEPRQELEERSDGFLEADLGSLRQALLAGDSNRAREKAQAMRRTDEASPEPDPAVLAVVDELTREAEACREVVDGLATAAGEHLEGGRLAEARDVIRALEEVVFEGAVYGPAADEAGALRRRFEGELESRASSLLQSTDGSSIDSIRELLELFEDPRDAYRTRLVAKIAELKKEVTLAELHSQATREKTSLELDELLEEMRAVDEASPMTAEVLRMRNRRLDQERSFGDALSEFDKRALNGLRAEIADYKRARDQLPSNMAAGELQALEQAEEWLDDYLEIGAVLGADLARAQGLLDALPPVEELDGDFQATAKRHREQLLARLEEARVREEALELVRQIETSCALLRLGTARSALEQLEALAAPGLEEELARATVRVDRLADLEQRAESSEETFHAFREQLRGGMSRDAASTLERLRKAWRTEADRIAATLERSDELGELRGLELQEAEALHLRRVRLLVRLGDVAQALSEAKGLGPSREGLLLMALARFERKPAPIREALVDVEEALALSGPDSSAACAYLRGALSYALWQWEPDDLELREEASSSLEAAVAQGLESADACYRLAEIDLNRGEAEQAVAYALMAQEAPITEEEILVGLDGVSAAPGKVQDFIRDVHFVSARAHGRLGDWNACRRACDRLLDLDQAFSYGYYWRGHALEQLGKGRDARDDYEVLVELIPADSSDPTLLDMRAEALLRLERLR